MLDIKKVLEKNSGLRSYAVRVGILKKPKRYFLEKYNILSNSIKKYEESSSLSSLITGRKIFEAFLSEGLHISEKWFFFGDGNPPVNDEIFSNLFYKFEDTESKAYVDTVLFKTRYTNSEVIIIEDNCNAPFYKYGDYVGFIWRKLTHIQSLYKTPCVIEMNDEIIVRICTKISDKKVKFECKNQSGKVVEADVIGPILFHRPSKYYRLINMEFFG